MLLYLQDEEALYDAVDREDVSAVRQLVARRVNVNCKSRQVRRISIYVCFYCCMPSFPAFV